MAITKTTDNALLKNIEEDALFVLREETMMLNFVTVYNGTGYATREVGIWAQATAQEVSEGVDFSNPTTLSKSSKATFVPKEAMAQFLLTDRAMTTDSESNIRQAAAMELGMSIAEKVDTDLVGNFSSFNSGAGSAGSALTVTETGVGLALLRNNKAKGSLVGVLHPYHWHDLWVELGQPAANQAFLGDVANRAMIDGFVERFNGVMWYLNANISIDASDDAYSAIFARDAMAFDLREAFSVRPDRDESLRATELNGHIGYAEGILRNESGVYLLADASTPS